MVVSFQTVVGVRLGGVSDLSVFEPVGVAN